MRICTLASGSSGNSLFIQAGRTRILVDAGINPKQLNLRLGSLSVRMSDIDAVIVTHEHVDHAAALPYISVPVYVASATVPLWKDKVKDLREFESGSPFSIRDLLVSPFPIPHDALDPVGFLVQTDHKKVGIVTDIGSVTSLVRERLKGSNALILEFNHDERMLLYGSYPWDLKQRIKSRLGHLSNEEAAGLLKDLIHDGLSHVVLVHLSESNNRPRVALEAASSVIPEGETGRIRLSVAPRKTLGEIINL
ncbi:MAG TPA: MBL fold metallo-hydrolase [Thermodesulfobacteriota bacterium]|nr:MBL fold metallo-hydrolase [Thermodesulfobacteriota bacterium]